MGACEQARDQFNAGFEHEARRLIARHRCAAGQAADRHAAWADLCEDLGLARQALDSWQKAIAADRQNSGYFCRLGLLYAETGSFDKAVKYLRRALDINPADARAAGTLADISRRIGEDGTATALGARTDTLPESAAADAAPPRIHIDDVKRLMYLFRGREPGYAKQEIDHAGRSVFVACDDPLSADLVVDHLMGRLTLGVFPLREDDTLRFAAVRAGINGQRLMRNIKNRGWQGMAAEAAADYAGRLYRLCRNSGIPGSMCDGGSRDRLVWFFFDSFLPRALVHRLTEQLIGLLPVPSADIQVDVLLGVQVGAQGWRREPVSLPLGRNPISGRRCFFIDADGNFADDQLACLRRIRTVRLDDVREFLSCARSGAPRANTSTNQPPGYTALVARCPVVAEVAGKSRAGRMLSEQEKMLLFYTMGFLGDKHNSLHYALELTPDYRPERVERQSGQLRPHPISCPKIRELLPRLTASVPCDCSFDVPAGGYPAPLLHIDPRLVTKATRADGQALPSSFDDAVRRVIQLRQRIEAQGRQLEKAENIVVAMLRDQGLQRARTQYGAVAVVDGCLSVQPLSENTIRSAARGETVP